MCRSDVLMHADGAVRRADQPGDLVANLDRHLPPAFLPGANAASGPGLRVSGKVPRRLARHSAERIADHVDGARQNRKLVAVLFEIERHGAIVLYDGGQWRRLKAG